MAYTVLQYFEDLQDRSHSYRAGDSFPRPGLSVSPERIAELSGADNLRGIPLIRSNEEKPVEAAAEAEPAPAKKASSRKKKTAE